MVYNVSLKFDKTAWCTESICTCKYFYSNFICKHIVGLALLTKIKKTTKEMLSNPISKKQARGRAAKAKRALIKL